VFKLFVSFPGEWQGVGLLILRLGVASVVLRDLPEGFMTGSSWLVVLVRAVLALVISIGFLTPIASVAGCVIEVLGLHGSGSVSEALAIFAIVDMAALALAGPGAYSLDARFFGRRLIVFPPEDEARFRHWRQ
jgi:hypothetical protein